MSNLHRKVQQMELSNSVLKAIAPNKEPEADKSREKNRVLIGFVPFNLGRFRVPYGNLVPGQLTIIPKWGRWKDTGKLRADYKQAKMRHEPLEHVRVAIYPGEVVPAIVKEATGGQYGDIGLRSIDCLIGIDSVTKLAALQEVLLPSSLFKDAKGRPLSGDLHKRVDDHLFTVIEDYEPSSIEVMTARVILESSQVGAAWKETVLREAQGEVLSGKSEGLGRLHNQWRQEIGVVLDDKVRLANSLPNEMQPNQLAARAPAAPMVVTAEPTQEALAAALDKLLADRGMKLVPVEPEPVAKATTKASK